MARAMGEFPKNLKSATNLHCRECNDALGKWDENNDCTVWKCWLYPYRPGKGGEERKVRVKSEARVAAGKARFSKLRTLPVDIQPIAAPANTQVATPTKTRRTRRIRDANGNLVPRTV